MIDKKVELLNDMIERYRSKITEFKRNNNFLSVQDKSMEQIELIDSLMMDILLREEHGGEAEYFEKDLRRFKYIE